MNEIILALIGGSLIGIATSLLLLFKGRIFGISGILGGIINPTKGDLLWRFMILGGLLSAGVILNLIYPTAFPTSATEGMSSVQIVLAGLLVGFGTQLGGGCTSGHGVCGISRLSKRSIVATLVFMTAGVAAVYVSRHMLGG